MEPITLTILAIMAATAGGAAIAVAAWQTIQNWIWGHRVPRGTAEVVKKRILNGNYVVVAGVFSPAGWQVATRSWTAWELDSELQDEFRRGGDKIVVRF